MTHATIITLFTISLLAGTAWAGEPLLPGNSQWEPPPQFTPEGIEQCRKHFGTGPGTPCDTHPITRDDLRKEWENAERGVVAMPECPTLTPEEEHAASAVRDADKKATVCMDKDHKKQYLRHLRNQRGVSEEEQQKATPQ